MSGLPWFRMYAEAVDDEKLRLLAFEDRWHFVALLCCKCRGMFDAGDDWPKLQRKLAVKLGVQLREMDEIHRRLQDVDLVDEWMEPINWDKRQRKADDSKERVRRHRERKAAQGSNGDVTDCNGDSNASRARPRPGADTEAEAEAEAEGVSPDGDMGDSGAAVCPQQQIIDLYHEILPELPPVKRWHDKRKKMLRARWREDPKHQTLDFWRKYFHHVRESDFLCGRKDGTGDRPPFHADLEWLVRPSNFAKVIEGRYHHG